MKVAILGLGPGNEEVPYSQYECWALNNDPVNRSRADVVFEMHEGEPIPEGPSVHCGNYPLNDVIADIGRDWFGSTIAYMVALAIYKKVPALGFWGVHMESEPEYAHQRNNLCWLIGLAEGRGIRIDHPLDWRLLQYDGPYPTRYGYSV